MTARMAALPPNYFRCQWCGGGVRFTAERTWPDRCPHCNMHPHPGKVDETVGGKVDPAKAATSLRNRKQAARLVPLSSTPAGQPVLGVDPGARYTGVVLRDGDVVLYSTTLVRVKEETDPVAWARHVVAEIKAVLVTACPPETGMGVEGVSAPKGFKDGKRQPIDPAPILFAGVVLGAVAAEWPDAVVIQPGGNGSQHVTNYPPELVGRRPKDLPGADGGAGTRDHEQSAYDVAGKAARVLHPPQRTDLRSLIASA
jgi:hypothetical protein